MEVVQSPAMHYDRINSGGELASRGPIMYQLQNHRTAEVHVMATIAGGAYIGARTRVEAFCTIDEGTCVSDDCTIGHGVQIRDVCTIHHKVTIGPGTMVGHRVLIGADSKIGARCTLEDHCVIAPGTIIPDETTVRGLHYARNH